MEIIIISEVEVSLIVVCKQNINVNKQITADPFNHKELLSGHSGGAGKINEQVIEFVNPKFYLSAFQNLLKISGDSWCAKDEEIVSARNDEGDTENTDLYNFETVICSEPENNTLVSQVNQVQHKTANRKNMCEKLSDTSVQIHDQCDNDLQQTCHIPANSNVLVPAPDKLLVVSEIAHSTFDGVLSCNSDKQDIEIDSGNRSEVEKLETDNSSDSGNEERKINNRSNISSEENLVKDKKFRCEPCGMTFSSKWNLERHRKTPRHLMKDQLIGTLKQQRFQCDMCSKDFASNSYLQMHKRVHTGEKPYSCSTCGKSFIAADLLKRHQMIHTGEFKYECDVCFKKFRQKTNFQIHIKTHTGEKPHKCDICGKGFVKKDNLKSHIRTHSNQKTFICELCGKGYYHEYNLKYHMQTHLGIKPWVCDVCGRGFSMKGHLDRHTMTHTGEKPYICEVCGFRTASRGALPAHMLRHTGEKPHTCEFCGRSFRKLSVLQQHHKIHQNGPRKRGRKKNLVPKSYSCSICQKSFAKKYRLTRHLKTHERKKENLHLFEAVESADITEIIIETSFF